MIYRELDAVILTRHLPEHGLRTGDLGAVVEVHSTETLEVEFVRASGQTQALVTLRYADLRPVQDRDLVAVRQIVPSTRGAA